MTFTTLFKQELVDLLEKKLKIPCKSEEVEYSKGTYKIKFDARLYYRTKIIIFEIELRRADPINNLVKVIHWICNSMNTKEIMMVHIFDKKYYSKPENKYKKDFTLFLARRCNLLHKNLSKFKYKHIDIEIDEKAYRKGDKNEAIKKASQLCKDIIKII